MLDGFDHDGLPLLGGGLVHPGEGAGAAHGVGHLLIFALRGQRLQHIGGGVLPVVSDGVPPGPTPAPAISDTVADRARSSSRSSGGGGKYSSSIVTGTEMAALGRRQTIDHRLDEGLGCRSSGGDRDGPAEIVWQLGGFVHSDHPGTARGPGDLLERRPCSRSWPSR